MLQNPVKYSPISGYISHLQDQQNEQTLMLYHENSIIKIDIYCDPIFVRRKAFCFYGQQKTHVNQRERVAFAPFGSIVKIYIPSNYTLTCPVGLQLTAGITNISIFEL